MTLRWLVASLHLLALGAGVAAITVRARALSRTRSREDLPSVFRADNWWAVAALVWLATGLWRAFGGLEKGSAYYLQHPLFHAKLGLFGLIILLELWPMITLIRWRLALRRSAGVELTRAGQLARLSYVELAVVLVMVFLATAVARGLGI